MRLLERDRLMSLWRPLAKFTCRPSGNARESPETLNLEVDRLLCAQNILKCMSHFMDESTGTILEKVPHEIKHCFKIWSVILIVPNIPIRFPLFVCNRIFHRPACTPIVPTRSGTSCIKWPVLLTPQTPLESPCWSGSLELIYIIV